MAVTLCWLPSSVLKALIFALNAVLFMPMVYFFWTLPNADSWRYVLLVAISVQSVFICYLAICFENCIACQRPSRLKIQAQSSNCLVMSTKLPIDRCPVNALDVPLLNSYPLDVPSFAVIPMKCGQRDDEQIANTQILRNVRTVGYLGDKSTRPTFRVYPIRSVNPGSITQDCLTNNQASSLPTYDEVVRVNVTAQDIRSLSNHCEQRSTVWSTGLSNGRSNDQYSTV